jgi:hypothetical protein
MGAAAAAATSIIGAGLGAYAQILSSQGTAAGMNYKASALESAAQRGRVGAAQTGASETEKLVTTLATRCARLPSPTLRRDRGGNPGLERNALSLTKKSIDVDNIMAQPAASVEAPDG